MAAGSLIFNLIYGKNDGLVISPNELVDTYLFGIPLCSGSGFRYSTDSITRLIKAAQTTMENYLALKLFKQYMLEKVDFNHTEFQQWAYTKASYNINSVYTFDGMLGEQSVISYPQAWLSTRSINNRGVSRNVYIVPNGLANASSVYLGSSYTLYYYLGGAQTIPNYWRLGYVTGFDKIPDDITFMIGKLAAIQMLLILGEIVGGSGLVGMSSQSLSLDGLSQSVSKANGGSIFAQRIRQYSADMKGELAALQDFYRGANLEVL